MSNEERWLNSIETILRRFTPTHKGHTMTDKRTLIEPCPECLADFEGGQQVASEASRLRTQREIAASCSMFGGPRNHTGAKTVTATQVLREGERRIDSNGMIVVGPLWVIEEDTP